MKPEFRYLSEDQKKAIHTASLRILEETGAYLYNGEAVSRFKKAGAKIGEGDRVYTQPKLVE